MVYKIDREKRRISEEIEGLEQLLKDIIHAVSNRFDINKKKVTCQVKNELSFDVEYAANNRFKTAN